MKPLMFAVLAGACALAAPSLHAADAVNADPVKVDPKHYSVAFENDSVRILRIHYEPGEKSVMHTHPDAVVIALTDAQTLMTFPDGKTASSVMKAGDIQATPAGAHLPQNTGSKANDLVLVEFKGKAATN